MDKIKSIADQVKTISPNRIYDSQKGRMIETDEESKMTFVKDSVMD